MSPESGQPLSRMPRTAASVELEITSRHVVLIGLMGAGKTTVGRLLASRLGWTFWDNDEALQEATGTTAAQLREQRGLAALHETENRLLQEALRARTQTVYAAAGSIVLSPELVRDALTIWLRITPAAEVSNILGSGQHHRPLPRDATGVLEHLSNERQAGYARLAKLAVDVAPQPEVTCERVMRALGTITQSA